MQVLSFHMEYSKDTTKFPLFALKVLSRFCGGYNIAKNANRIVLIERQFALRIFGQGICCQALRAPYYLAYVAQALMLGITEANQLLEYGKRILMRSRGLHPLCCLNLHQCCLAISAPKVLRLYSLRRQMLRI